MRATRLMLLLLLTGCAAPGSDAGSVTVHMDGDVRGFAGSAAH